MNLIPGRSAPIAALAASLCAATTDAAHAQIVTCNQSLGPDLIFADTLPPANYASQGGIDAFAAGSVYANIGSEPVISETSVGSNHPLTGQGLFRLKTVNGASRIEQIGMMWLHHVFCPLSQNGMCACQAPPDCETLGVGCSSPDTAGVNGGQAFMQPRWQVNAAAVTFPIVPADPPFSGSIARRLQAKHSDLDPAQNAGALYYVEMFILAADDAAAGNPNNNFSHRLCNITGGPSEWNMSIGGAAPGMQRGKPAISAWKASDPSVFESLVDLPNDGRFIVAGRAKNLGNGAWHYEYAVENLNSDLSARSFTVPLPAGAQITNIGFHDVDYHSGDGIGNVTTDGTDWAASVTEGGITWSTQDFATNPNANALRFATLYNFRFDCDAAPSGGNATLGTFKAAGTAAAQTIVPGGVGCIGDIAPAGKTDHIVDVDDLFAVIQAWGPCATPCEIACAADITHDCIVDVDDLMTVVNTWGPCQ